MASDIRAATTDDVRDELVDPWAVAVAPSRRDVPRWVRLVAAAVLGAAAPVARLAVDGFHGRALAVGALAVGWLLLVELRPRTPVGVAVLAAGAAGAMALTWSAIGRAPVLVALVGVVAAHAALVEWRPLSSWPQRSTPVAGLAVLPLAASQVLWFREESPAVTGGLLLLSLAVVEAYARVPAPLARADRAFVAALVGLATAIGSLVLFVVVSVVLYLPGLAGAAVDRLRRRRARSSYWAERGRPTEEVVADARRPFSSAPPRQRRARNVVGVGAVAAVAAVLVVVGSDRRDAQQELAELEQADVFERAASVRFSDLPAYEGQPWADDLKAEQDVLSNQYLRESPVAGYDVADFDGEFTNVTGGARRTIEPPPCEGCPPRTVWLAGGSSAFGLGQRDEHTIASELVRVAADEGISLRVVNLGVPGYTIHQEAQKVLARLDAGGPPPDTVVFFNGYNDTVATVMDATVNGIRPDEPTLMETEVIRTFTGEGLDPWSAGTPEELGALAAAKYRREATAVSAELARRGVDAVFVFQPDALASPEQYDAVAGIYELAPRVREHMDGSLEVASDQLGDIALDLRHLLDDEPPVFADLVHTNEDAARIVAAELIGQIGSAN